MKFCSECGRELPQNSVFCPFCGRMLVSSPFRSQTHWWHFAYVMIPACFYIILCYKFPNLDVRVIEMMCAILSSFLLIMDVKELKWNGFTPEGWIFLGLIFSPLYLLVRGIKTKYWWGMLTATLIHLVLLFLYVIQ